MYPFGGGTTREQSRRRPALILFCSQLMFGNARFVIFFIFLSTKPTKYDYLLSASPSHRDRWHTNGIGGPDKIRLEGASHGWEDNRPNSEHIVSEYF